MMVQTLPSIGTRMTMEMKINQKTMINKTKIKFILKNQIAKNQKKSQK
jgi:hypothetical protein